jgi:SAM-dependent methyltransferase
MVYTRSDERESAAAYRAWLSATGPGAAFVRFLSSPFGSFLINTPLFLLPRRLGIHAGQRVLDIGCGRGSTLRFLTSRIRFAKPPVGIDISPEILDRAANELGPNRRMELVAAAATRLPFGPDSFDLVLCSYVVRHLGDEALHRFFYECWRVLRPGGTLVVLEFAPTRSRPLNWFHQWLLTRHVNVCRLRGYGDFVELAIESQFANMEILLQRPFLFPPIPRTGFLLRKALAKTDG